MNIFQRVNPNNKLWDEASIIFPHESCGNQTCIIDFLSEWSFSHTKLAKFQNSWGGGLDPRFSVYFVGKLVVDFSMVVIQPPSSKTRGAVTENVIN